MSAFPATRIITAPSPALTGTTLTVTEDTGPLFPPTPFTALAWGPDDLPSTTTSEELEVTARSGDVFTCTRATSPVAIQADWMFALLRAMPTVELNEKITLRGTFSGNLPPYTLRTRSPQGRVSAGGTIVDAGGGTVSSELNADESGVWYYRFETADEVLAERSFYVPHGRVI